VSKFDLVVSAVGLSNADLSGIDFSHTIVTEEQWKKVKSLKDATMPNGSTHC
jgi:hypothetical protein